jgi:hypothetical protein
MRSLWSVRASPLRWKCNMRGVRCFAITVTPLDIMSPLADGYILNNQRIKMIVGNKSLWLRKHPPQQLGRTQMDGLPLRPMAVPGLGFRLRLLRQLPLLREFCLLLPLQHWLRLHRLFWHLLLLAHTWGQLLILLQRLLLLM